MQSAKRAIAVSGIAIVLIWATVASGAMPSSGAEFSGETSQPAGSVNFEISSDGTLVTDFTATMTAACTKKKSEKRIEVGLTPTSRIRIREGGAFSHVGGFTLLNGSEVIGSGTGSVSGVFTSSTEASGSLNFPWTYYSNAGLLSGYKCETGKVTFSASPRKATPAPSSPPGASPTSNCVVPKVSGKKLKAAKRLVKGGNCSLGRIARRHSGRVKRGRVLAQKPGWGTRLSAGAKVKLVVSSGPARR
jgi:hypothetical protein